LLPHEVGVNPRLQRVGIQPLLLQHRVNWADVTRSARNRCERVLDLAFGNLGDKALRQVDLELVVDQLVENLLTDGTFWVES